MTPAPHVVITGGAGYIGSHTCIELLNAGWVVTVIDSLVNALPESLRRVERICGRSVTFFAVDMCDHAALQRIFSAASVDAVIHFAGLKAVGESVQQPLRYYRNNLTATLNLLAVMTETGCRNLVFSSSATVYGEPEHVPLTEDCRLRTTNPYGATKLMIEGICADVAASAPDWHIALLRYFNPVGAHPSGLIGEDPAGIPSNLVPYILQVAVGKRPHLTIHGGDWPTPDGTGVRDYLHVVDLAKGHLAALAALPRITGSRAFNLGTGRGVSVLEMVAATERAAQCRIAHVIGPRRPGDIAVCYADATRAERELGWTAEFDLAAMCADGWRWQQQNPNGYR